MRLAAVVARLTVSQVAGLGPDGATIVGHLGLWRSW